MSTFIVDIARVGQLFYSEVSLYCAQVGQQHVTNSVYKEAISQILSFFDEEPEAFFASTYMLPQWASINYVVTFQEHEAARTQFRLAIQAAALSLYNLIVMNNIVPRPPRGSLYKLDTVNQMTLQFSILENSPYV